MIKIIKDKKLLNLKTLLKIIFRIHLKMVLLMDSCDRLETLIKMALKVMFEMIFTII